MPSDLHSRLHLAGPGYPAPLDPSRIPAGVGAGPTSLRELSRIAKADPDRVQFFATPLAQPMPVLPYAADIGQQVRDYGVSINTNTDPDVTVGLPTLRLVRVDLPVAFFALTGAARRLAGAMPDGVGDRYLNTFKLRLEYVLSDKIFTIDMLGDAACGNGAFPRYFGGPGLVFDTRANLNVYITPLYDNLEVTLDFMAVEIREATMGIGRGGV